MLRPSRLPLVLLALVTGCRGGAIDATGLQAGLRTASQVLAQGVEGAAIETKAVHADSLPTALAASADGRYLFSAEGGKLAILRSGPTGDLHEEIKKPTIDAGTGVRPARLLLDPDADLDDESGALGRNLIFVAGGRSGLWVMDANVFADQRNLAARVDDATHPGSGNQDSRRWCVDLSIASVAGESYLFALFGAKGDSRLRAYRLQDVRAVLWDESGEIDPLFDVRFAAHPAAPPGQRALGLSLALDSVSADRVDAYVALASHGLARVTCVPANFASAGPAPTPLYGPVFGDGSHYNTTPHENPGWYANLQFRDGRRIERSVPPYFIDVAVQNGASGHYLYAALDHLGWARFDLDVQWGAQLAIDHHEGVPIPDHPWGQSQLSLSPIVPGPARKRFDYVRRVEVASLGSEPLLVTTASCYPFFAQMHGLLTEGRVLDHSGSSFNGVSESALEDVRGDTATTLVYRIAAPNFGTQPLNFAAREDLGGVTVIAPPRQPVGTQLMLFGSNEGLQLPGGEGGELKVVPDASYRAVADVVAGSIIVTHSRTREDRPGRLTYGIGDSLLRPDLLWLGSNDAGIFPDGFLVDCGTSIRRHSSGHGANSAGHATQGILFDPSAQWPAAGSSDSQFVLGGAPRPPGRFHGTWRVSKYSVPSTTLCMDAPPTLPERTNHWQLSGPPDRFGYRGRWFFQGTLDGQYDAEVTGPGDTRSFLFASRTGTDEGVVVLRRDLLESTLAPLGEPPLPDGNLDLVAAPFPEDVVVTTLVTHPEFGAVDESHPDGANFIVSRAGGSTLTLAPKLVRLAGTPGGARDHWVLGVPCFNVANDPDLPIYTRHPEWKPGEVAHDWASTFSRLLVQFWDVDDPDAISAQSTLPHIIGAEDGGSAYFIEFAEVGGRIYLFTADFGGRVLVHDVTELLYTATPPPRVARWVAPLGLSDDIPNNVQGLAVDNTGSVPLVYVAVPRVGVLVLRFDPSAASAQRLSRVALVETPGNVRSVHLAPGGRLLVADGEAGVRVLGPVSSE